MPLYAFPAENPASERGRGDVGPFGYLPLAFATGLLDAVGLPARLARLLRNNRDVGLPGALAFRRRAGGFENDADMARFLMDAERAAHGPRLGALQRRTLIHAYLPHPERRDVVDLEIMLRVRDRGLEELCEGPGGAARQESERPLRLGNALPPDSIGDHAHLTGRHAEVIQFGGDVHRSGLTTLPASLPRALPPLGPFARSLSASCHRGGRTSGLAQIRRGDARPFPP